MTDLGKLIEAVEAGHRGLGLNTAAVFGDNQTAMDAVDAFDGSLDAAKALHEALLPGWWCELRHSTRPRAVIGYDEGAHEGQDDTLSRAWLLAILRALQSQVKP